LDELDKAKRIQNNVTIQDYLAKWRLVAPVLDLLNYHALSPKIAEWKPHGAPTPLFNSPETVRLK
ncbi:MAG: hypothetical protein HY682_07310, partial [Chloroflexi bacterium]|nr:hypothetical protein [Chloroflexota bacterium]